MQLLDFDNFRRPGDEDLAITLSSRDRNDNDQSVDSPPEEVSPDEVNWNHTRTKVVDKVVQSRRNQFGVLRFSNESDFWKGITKRADIRRLTIVADHFVVRGKLHVPQCHIRIIARVLEFEDIADHDLSCICTTPLPPPKPEEEPAADVTVPNRWNKWKQDIRALATAKQDPTKPSDRPKWQALREAAPSGIDGLDAGSITLSIHELKAPATRLRFDLRGGSGQTAFTSINGRDGDDPPEEKIKNLVLGGIWGFRAEEMMLAISEVAEPIQDQWTRPSAHSSGRRSGPVNLPTIVEIRANGWTHHHNYGSQGDRDGRPAIRDGKPGNGGNGGVLSTSVELADDEYDVSGGKPGEKGEVRRGGQVLAKPDCASAKLVSWSGTPAGPYLEYIRLKNGRGWKDDDKHFIWTLLAPAKPGDDAEPLAGVQGPSGQMAKTNERPWQSPELLNLVFDSARSACFSEIPPAEIKEFLLPYSKISIRDIDQRTSQSAAHIQALHFSLSAGLDYFCNPPNWVPYRSFSEIVRRQNESLRAQVNMLFLAYLTERASLSAKHRIAVAKWQSTDLADKLAQAGKTLQLLKDDIDNWTESLGPLVAAQQRLFGELKAMDNVVTQLAKDYVDGKRQEDNEHAIISSIFRAGSVIPYVGPAFATMGVVYEISNKIEDEGFRATAIAEVIAEDQDLLNRFVDGVNKWISEEKKPNSSEAADTQQRQKSPAPTPDKNQKPQASPGHEAKKDKTWTDDLKEAFAVAQNAAKAFQQSMEKHSVPADYYEKLFEDKLSKLKHLKGYQNVKKAVEDFIAQITFRSEEIRNLLSRSAQITVDMAAIRELRGRSAILMTQEAEIDPDWMNDLSRSVELAAKQWLAYSAYQMRKAYYYEFLERMAYSSDPENDYDKIVEELENALPQKQDKSEYEQTLTKEHLQAAFEVFQEPLNKLQSSFTFREDLHGDAAQRFPREQGWQVPVESLQALAGGGVIRFFTRDAGVFFLEDYDMRLIIVHVESAERAAANGSSQADLDIYALSPGLINRTPGSSEVLEFRYPSRLLVGRCKLSFEPAALEATVKNTDLTDDSDSGALRTASKDRLRPAALGLFEIRMRHVQQKTDLSRLELQFRISCKTAAP